MGERGETGGKRRREENIKNISTRDTDLTDNWSHFLPDTRSHSIKVIIVSFPFEIKIDGRR